MAIGTARVGSAATGTTSLSIPEPASLVSGDLIVVLIVDHATSGTGTGPSGFTRGASVAGTTASGRLEMFYGFYQDVGAGPWTFGSRTSRSLGRALAYSGVDGGTPMDVTASSRENASGTYGSSSITPVTDGNEVIALYGQTASGQTWSSYSVGNSNPSTLTEQIDTAYSSYCSFAAADGNQTTAGATGASTATPSSACANLGILMALRPGAGNISSSDSTESVTLSENLTTSIVLAASAYETIDFREVFSGTWETAITLSEYVNASILSNISGSVNDTSTLTEFVSAKVGVSGLVFDTATLSENLTGTITFAGNVFNTATLTEFVSAAIGVSGNVFDSATLSEDLSASVSLPGLSASVYDTVNFQEVFSGAWELAITVSEYLNASISSGSISADVYDSITVSEASGIDMDTMSFIDDEYITILESVSVSYSNIGVSANESLTLSEYVSPSISAGGVTGSAFDSITLSEYLTALINWFASVNDTATLSEFVSAQIIISGLVFDTATLTENLTGTISWSGTANETITLSEFVSVGSVLSATVNDSATLSELIAGAIVLASSVNNTLTLTENLTGRIVLSSPVSDTLSMSEFLAAAITGSNLAVFVSDTLTLEELVSVSGLGIHGLSYVIPLTGEVGYDALNKRIVKELDDMMPVSSCIEKIL